MFGFLFDTLIKLSEADVRYIGAADGRSLFVIYKGR